MHRHADAELLQLLSTTAPPADLQKVSTFASHLGKFHQEASLFSGRTPRVVNLNTIPRPSLPSTQRTKSWRRQLCLPANRSGSEFSNRLKHIICNLTIWASVCKSFREAERSTVANHMVSARAPNGRRPWQVGAMGCKIPSFCKPAGLLVCCLFAGAWGGSC